MRNRTDLEVQDMLSIGALRDNQAQRKRKRENSEENGASTSRSGTPLHTVPDASPNQVMEESVPLGGGAENSHLLNSASDDQEPEIPEEIECQLIQKTIYIDRMPRTVEFIMCNQCPRLFRTENLLWNHIKGSHLKRKRAYQTFLASNLGKNITNTLAAKDLQNSQNKNVPTAGAIGSRLNNDLLAVGNTGSSLTITKAVPAVVKSRDFETDENSSSRQSSLEITRVPSSSTNGTCNVPLTLIDGTPRVVLPSTNGKQQLNHQSSLQSYTNSFPTTSTTTPSKKETVYSSPNTEIPHYSDNLENGASVYVDDVNTQVESMNVETTNQEIPTEDNFLFNPPNNTSSQPSFQVNTSSELDESTYSSKTPSIHQHNTSIQQHFSDTSSFNQSTTSQNDVATTHQPSRSQESPKADNLQASQEDGGDNESDMAPPVIQYIVQENSEMEGETNCADNLDQSIGTGSTEVLKKTLVTLEDTAAGNLAVTLEDNAAGNLAVTQEMEYLAEGNVYVIGLEKGSDEALSPGIQDAFEEHSSVQPSKDDPVSDSEDDIHSQSSPSPGRRKEKGEDFRCWRSPCQGLDKFSSHKSIQQHLEKVHEMKMTSVPCDVCGQHVTQTNLWKHKESVHKIFRSFTCPHCDTQFCSQADMERHLKSVEMKNEVRYEDKENSENGETYLTSVDPERAQEFLKRVQAKEYPCGECGWKTHSRTEYIQHVLNTCEMDPANSCIRVPKVNQHLMVQHEKEREHIMVEQDRNLSEITKERLGNPSVPAKLDTITSPFEDVKERPGVIIRKKLLEQGLVRRHNVPAWMEDMDVINHDFDTVDNSHNPTAASSTDGNNVFQVVQEGTIMEHSSFESRNEKRTGQEESHFMGLLNTPEHIPIDSSSNMDQVNKEGQMKEMLYTRHNYKLIAPTSYTQNSNGKEQDVQFAELLGSTTTNAQNGNDQLIAFGEPQMANQLIRNEEPEMTSQLMDLGHVVADQLIQLVQGEQGVTEQL